MSKITHDHRLRQRLAKGAKGIKAFRLFWKIFDDNCVSCFVCGKYIPRWMREQEMAFQPNGKKKDWVHKNCFRGISWEEASKNKFEYIICHIESGFTGLYPKNVCRKKINCNEDDINQHVLEHIKKVGFVRHDYKMFLKPNGKPLTKPLEF